MRGLACLLILVYHIMPHRIPCGWIAVDLFFVLSGYLITSIVLKFSEEKRFLLHFYVRRGLRIWPVYFLTVVTMAARGSLPPAALCASRPAVPADLHATPPVVLVR